MAISTLKTTRDWRGSRGAPPTSEFSIEFNGAAELIGQVFIPVRPNVVNDSSAGGWALGEAGGDRDIKFVEFV
ncbi:MAG TPA: hypothetical protein VMK12_31545 [Anaeromyxobacteraceae bacterium]|nr:hypothetical protein [Anaeromyxobacteraceae bacterium]